MGGGKLPTRRMVRVRITLIPSTRTSGWLAAYQTGRYEPVEQLSQTLGNLEPDPAGAQQSGSSVSGLITYLPT